MANASRYDAIVATLVGVLALLVSAYTAHVQRQQVRAQVLPILTYATGYSDKDVHIKVANKGSGPALIRNMRVTLDGQPVRSWMELLRRALPAKMDSHSVHFSNTGRIVLTPGEEDEVFKLSTENPQQEPADKNAPRKLSDDILPDDADCARLVQALRRASVSICYCSTLGDCWTLYDAPNDETHTDETRRCPERDERSFN